MTLTSGWSQQLLANKDLISGSVAQWQVYPTQTVSLIITNAAGGSAGHSYWFLTTNAWLSVSPSNGNSINTYRTVTVSYATANLSPGTYQSVIRIVSPLATNLTWAVTNSITVTNNPLVTQGLRIAPDLSTMVNTTNFLLPIQLVSAGNVNAVGFSLNYNKSYFSNPRIALGAQAGGGSLLTNTSGASSYGRVGVGVRLGAGAAFPAGVSEVAVIQFNVASNSYPMAYAFAFTNTPMSLEISDTSAITLSGAWPTGNVLVVAGYESDVSPRGSNDAAVTVTDWTQIGRFVAGLDSTANVGEFQRADCAPFSIFGDGALRISDWVQAGRYVGALDPLSRASGPPFKYTNTYVSLRAGPRSLTAKATRTLSVADRIVARGETNTVQVWLDAQGDENACGFSLVFDPTRLTYVTARRVSRAEAGDFIINATQASTGKVGFAVALSSGDSFSASNQALVEVDFVTASGSGTEWTTVTLADAPVIREVASVTAEALTSSFTDATNIILGDAYPTAPQTPAGVTASDGTYSNSVQVAWSAVEGTTLYEIWRGTANTSALAVYLGYATSATYADTSVTVGTNYYYWVLAKNARGASALSAGDSGYASVAGTSGGTSGSSGTNASATTRRVMDDFDGDGRTDFAIYSGASGEWYILLSGRDYQMVTVSFGAPGYEPVSGDYDGDGLSDFAVYGDDAGDWYLLLSGSDYRAATLQFGAPDYAPVAGDFDGDGLADFALYDEAGGQWFAALSADGYGVARVLFGAPDYEALAGDFDGDGRADPALYGDASGCWFAALSGSGYAIGYQVFGAPGYSPVAGDYDGDGRADFAVYGDQSGTWYLLLSGSGYTLAGLSFGGAGYSSVK